MYMYISTLLCMPYRFVEKLTDIQTIWNIKKTKKKLETSE